MRDRTPTIHCDAEDCGGWDVDYYAADVSAVDGVRVTSAERAPGWSVTAGGDDLCPAHTEGALLTAAALVGVALLDRDARWGQ